MSKYTIVGNWKMNPMTIDEAKSIAKKTRAVASKLKQTDVIMCPPFVYIPSAVSKKKTAHCSVGAQFVSTHESGAHTGEVSAHMLADAGVTHVIVGHSETRKRGDTNEIVSQRLAQVLAAGLKAIVCVGEDARDDMGGHFEIIREQMKSSLVTVQPSQLNSILIAYEPVWAIGAAQPMSSEQIHETSIFVKKVFADLYGQEAAMKVDVIYGGAVNASNAAEIIRVGKVDGLLPGRESINPPGFAELLRAVDAVQR